MNRNKFFPLCLALIALCLLSACTSDKRSGREVITVSIAPLRYATEAVADSIYDVSVLMPDGASPETYQPTPQQVARLTESKVLFRIGTLGFEQTQIDKMLQNTPHLPCVSVARGIPAIPHDGGNLASESNDPHTWTSPRSMKVIARNICRTLSDLDTIHAAAFAANLQRFSTRMDSLDAAVARILRGAKSKAFLAYHPSLAYFARDYGLTQLSIQTDGKDPSPQHMANILSECRRQGVRIIFLQKGFNSQLPATIAEEIGAEVVEVDPLSANFEEEITKIATALTR